MTLCLSFFMIFPCVCLSYSLSDCDGPVVRKNGQLFGESKVAPDSRSEFDGRAILARIDIEPVIRGLPGRSGRLNVQIFHYYELVTSPCLGQYLIAPYHFGIESGCRGYAATRARAIRVFDDFHRKAH